MLTFVQQRLDLKNVCLKNSTDGGSTVVQQRVDGLVDFNQTWKKYEQGFGDLESKYNLAFAKTF